jgi:hypothetical protein
VTPKQVELARPNMWVYADYLWFQNNY